MQLHQSKYCVAYLLRVSSLEYTEPGLLVVYKASDDYK